MRKSFFIEGSNFYKGNIHAHTTMSDGALPLEEAIEAYRSRGYSFLAISDHERYFNSEAYDGGDFLVYPAIEYAVEQAKDGHKGHHLHGIWGTKDQMERAGDKVFKHGQVLEKLTWKSPHTVQQALDILRGAGNLVIYNHPIWSRLELDDLLNVHGLFGIEIYNWNCEVNDATEPVTLFWDMMLRRGKRVFGIASDDSHNGIPFESPYSDSFGGWIVVAARNLSRESLAEALVQGSFYASNGPEVSLYAIDDGVIYVECSPVDKVNFISYERRGSVKFADNDQGMTSATHKLRGDELFVRVECVDKYGKKAWTQPIFLEDL